MSFSTQLPGSVSFRLFKDAPEENPSAGGIETVFTAFHSYIERSSCITNPICLQADVIYPNAFAAMAQPDAGMEGAGPSADGCMGHMIDNEFPLEPRTPFALPFVMYPTNTNGTKHHEVDLCAKPVLNWEGYINEVKYTYKNALPGVESFKKRKSKSNTLEDKPEEELDKDAAEESNNRKDPLQNHKKSSAKNITNNNKKKKEQVPTGLNKISGSKEIYTNNRMARDVIIACQKTHDVEETTEERKARIKIKNGNGKKRKKSKNAVDEMEMLFSKIKFRPSTVPTGKKNALSRSAFLKLKNVPEFRLEGSWNYLFGGYTGACCFMKTSTTIKSSTTKLKLFVGKGALLRSVELKTTLPSQIFSYALDSVWEEDRTSLPFNKNCSQNQPFDDLIFQIIPNEPRDLLGVRRGKSVQIYSTENEAPYLLESIPNILYGTEKYIKSYLRRKLHVEDPLITGMDFNPIYCTELATVDENNVVRFCDISEGCTKDTFVLPRNTETSFHLAQCPKNYPCFKINEASGITFANCNDLFYGWADSTVYLGDRRDREVSRSHLSPLLDLRNDRSMLVLTEQSTFHNSCAKLSEFVSCVRRSKQEPYYYVGTSTKIYLMDRRVPSLPVLKVTHGLQSPLAYMDIVPYVADDNFEMIIGSSQRLPETVCMIVDNAHTACIDRSGCQAVNPILHSYPFHLSNSRPSFDFAIKNGYDFPFPSQFDQVKNHHHAWTTGLATYPLYQKDTKIPPGFIVATSNNFGDVFWQEWDQKPIPSHRKTRINDYSFRTFMEQWKDAVTPKFSEQVFKPSKNVSLPGDCSILLEPLAGEIPKLRRIRDTPFDVFKPSQLQYETNVQTLVPMPKLIGKLRNYKNERVKGMLDVWSMTYKQPPTALIPEREVSIKEEPQDNDGSVSFGSLHTIELDASEQVTPSREQDNFDLEDSILQAIHANESDDDEDLLEEAQNQDDENMEVELFENSQDLMTGIPSPNQNLPKVEASQEEGIPGEWLSMQRLHSSMKADDDDMEPVYAINPGMYSSSQPLFPDYDSQAIPSTSTGFYSQQSRQKKQKLAKSRKSGFL